MNLKIALIDNDQVFGQKQIFPRRDKTTCLEDFFVRLRKNWCPGKQHTLKLRIPQQIRSRLKSSNLNGNLDFSLFLF